MTAYNEDSLVGHVFDVRGDGFGAHLLANEQGITPTVTLGSEDILVGQIGSYMVVKQGSLEVLCIVNGMTEKERQAEPDPSQPDAPILTFAERTISLVPLGTITEEGQFERGIKGYPTSGADVHVVSGELVEVLFQKFRGKGYGVGQLSSQPNVEVCFEPSRLFGRHFAILGQTGAGKSWTVASLIQKALGVMPKAHIILLDLHGEYSWVNDEGVRLSAFNDEHHRYIDARELEMPYWLMTYAELCDLLIDQTEYSAHNQTAVFKDCLGRLRQAEAAKLGLERATLDTPIYFDIGELRAFVESKNGLVPGKGTNMIKGPLTGAFDNFLMRLDSKMGDIRYDFLLKPEKRNNSESLSSLLRDFVGLGEPKRPISIIDLSTVPFDVRPTVAAQIGRLAFEFNYWNPQYREFPILLVCEEAHAYITRDNSSQYAGARKSMERIAKEGRKYGVGLGVVSQRPHELSETVLAQCGSFICLRITNPADQSYVRSLLPEAERGLIETLAGLGGGEALALGEAVPLPTKFQFHKPSPQPNSEDIDFYTHWRDGPDDIDVEAIVDKWRKQERVG